MADSDRQLGDIATVVLLENDKVKIWNLIVEPGEASDWHMHERDYVTVCVEGGGLDAEYEDGTSGKGSTGVGDWTYHGDHQVHQVSNNTAKRFKNLLIELKY